MTSGQQAHCIMCAGSPTHSGVALPFLCQDLATKKLLTCVSKAALGVHGRGAWRGFGRKGWRRVGTGLAKGWERVGGFPCTLQLFNPEAPI